MSKTRIIAGRTKKEIIEKLSEPTQTQQQLAAEVAALARVKGRNQQSRSATAVPHEEVRTLMVEGVLTAPPISPEHQSELMRIIREGAMRPGPRARVQMLDTPAPVETTIMGMRVVVDDNVPPGRVYMVQEGQEAHMDQQSFNELQEAIRQGRLQSFNFSGIRAAGPAIARVALQRFTDLYGRSPASGRCTSAEDRMRGTFNRTFQDLTGINPAVMEERNALVPIDTPRVRRRNETCHGCRFNQGNSQGGTMCGQRAGRVVPNERCQGYRE